MKSRRLIASPEAYEHWFKLARTADQCPLWVKSGHDLFGHAGDIVDKVLRGRKPAEIPVELPTKFDLVVNRVTAEALGLNIPDKLLALADEVIE